MRWLFILACAVVGAGWFYSRDVRAAGTKAPDIDCATFDGRDWLMRCENSEAICYMRGGAATGDMECKFK